MTEIGIRACRARCRRCSAISAGPVAQFRPIMSMPSGSSAVSAAPISEPSSIVPVVSTVTCTMTGRSTPTQSRARRAPMTAAFVWSRSCEVSMRRASAPPRIRPSAFRWKASRSGSYVTWPRVGSFVPGPIEPRTQRGRPSAAVCASAVVRAIRAPASDSSYTWFSMPYSASAARFAPKVFVSTQSTPTEK